jgi:hypothetical protein
MALRYQVFHDVPGDAFNLDHVCIGSAGAFTVETKTWSKSASGNARIQFDGQRLLVNGHEPERDVVAQAQAQARWLARTLQESTGRSIPVQPVVVFPGWFVEASPGAHKSVWVTELNAWLADRCRALWEEVRHPEHEQFSVAEMLEHERAHLMPMPTPFDGYVEKPARVSSTCLVSVARNRYSVPCELHGQMVSTRLYPASVVIVADDRIVARHDRLSNAGETRYDWQHYIPLLQRKPGALRNGAPFADMPEPLQRLRRALLRNPGGDRVMAQVLAIVLTAGLDAVLVAVELALETGPPGKVSVEHVVNVLGRLNAQPAPPTAATHLKATTPPLADTARYDRLRADSSAADAVDAAITAATEGASHEA